MPEQSLRALLVEDNQDLLEVLADILWTAGMEVSKAIDAPAVFGLLA